MLFSPANTVQDLLKTFISDPENCLQINFSQLLPKSLLHLNMESSLENNFLFIFLREHIQKGTYPFPSIIQCCSLYTCLFPLPLTMGTDSFLASFLSGVQRVFNLPDSFSWLSQDISIFLSPFWNCWLHRLFPLASRAVMVALVSRSSAVSVVLVFSFTEQSRVGGCVCLSF